jgi:hypothetical protein
MKFGVPHCGDWHSGLLDRLLESVGQLQPPEEMEEAVCFEQGSQDRTLVDLDRIFDETTDADAFEPTERDLASIERAFREEGRPEDGEESIRNNGALRWDVCAWYQPIHFYGREWGIYVSEDCVFSAARLFARFAPASAWRQATAKQWFNLFTGAAFLSYFFHEHYHHRVESLGFRLQTVLGRSCYLPYKEKIYRVLKQNLGLFPSGPYINGWNPDEQLEEALANANSYRKLSGRGWSPASREAIGAAKKALAWQFPNDPPGYRMAGRYLGTREFHAGESLLKKRVCTATLAPEPAREWDLTPDMTKAFFGQDIPIYSVVTKGAKHRFPIRTP